MAAIENLRELEVREVNIAHWGGIVALVACRKLTSLTVTFEFARPDDFKMLVSTVTYPACTALHFNKLPKTLVG
jgi:hypothetical protein